MSLGRALERAQARWRYDFEDWLAELRIPSVGTMEQHRQDTFDNAYWLAEHFAHAGLDASLWGLDLGMPLVLAEWRGRPGAPTITIYGHYDVQPPDPLELWDSPPFEPAIRDGRVYARGAADSKGNHLAALKAVEHALATGELPVNVRFLIEGEEESVGSVLPHFVKDHAAELAADCVLLLDGTFTFDGLPLLLSGARGVLYSEIHAYGPHADLSSGEFGGVAPNPINSLAHVLAGLKDRRGHITIPHFYDQIRPASADELAAWSELATFDNWIATQIGARALEGEPNWGLVERLSVRPTLDSHGIWGGFAVEGGIKTVIPAHAAMKVSMRLVPDQNLDRIFESLVAYAPMLSTPGVRIEVRRLGAAQPVLIDTNHNWAAAICRAFEDTFGCRPRRLRAGGSLPILADLARLGQPMICTGFAQADCNEHSPNECCVIDHVRLGIETLLRFFWLAGS